MLRSYTDESGFDYEPPRMEFDKKTGEIKILERLDDPRKKTKKILHNLDSFAEERKNLLKEMGLNEDGRSDAAKEPVDKFAEKLMALSKKLKEEYEIDPSGFYVFSSDDMRVDCGLMIQRPPIFLHMNHKDFEFMKYKSALFNEYYMDQRVYVNEVEEVAKLNEQLLHDNPQKSRMNLDNYPTYKIKDESTGAEMDYCAASKHFSKVDPNIQDRRTMHYAGEDRTYLLVKNRYTKDWEFPTTKMFFGETFLKAKQNLFTSLTQNEWKVRYSGMTPVVSTIREFTQDEKQDSLNLGLNGVRTYFFQANHYRGLPTMFMGEGHNEFEDYAWVPKRLLNEYFDKDYYEIFINATLTR